MGAQPIELSRRECLDQVRTRTVGRICIIDHGCPLALPINFRLTDTGDLRVIVRTAPDTMLGRYLGPGSLEVDDVDLARGTAWSVLVRGEIRRAVDPSGLPDPHPLVVDERHHWLTLDVTAISGRQFTIRPADDLAAVEWQLA